MKLIKILFIFLAFQLSAQDELAFENINYKKTILTGYFQNTSLSDNLPMIALGTNQKLIFHFDEKSETPGNYNYAIVHCDENWNASDLFESEFIEGYTEENISDFTYSKNTDFNYIHYQFFVPSDQMKITKSGNYALLVYEDFDKGKLVLTRQFYVIQDQLQISIEGRISNIHGKKMSNHDFSGKVDISSIRSSNPNEELTFKLIKNNDVRNDFIFLKPSNFVTNNLVVFDPFLNTIPAGNEFRFFDIRNFNQKGIGVYEIVKKDSLTHIVLEPDKSRNKIGYSQYFDRNGKMVIQGENWQASTYETNFLMVHFYLNSEQPLTNSSVYIYGELTNWNYLPEAKLRYNTNSKQYVGELLLKQGVYDYAYVVIPDSGDLKAPKANWEYFEGNYAESGNEYLLLIYYKPFSANYQKLIGVKRFKYF